MSGDKPLFELTNTRTFAPDYKWHPGEVQIHKFLVFGEDESVADHYGWEGRDYMDKITDVRRLGDEEVQALRNKATEFAARMSRFSRYGPHYGRCCDLAIVHPCVCSVSWNCPVHGRHCHGSHD